MGSCSTWPGARFGGLDGICDKIAWRAPQRFLHPVTDLRIPPVQRLTRDSGEDVGHEIPADLSDIGVEVLEADRDVPDRATNGSGQFDRHVGEGHQARARHLVKLPLCPASVSAATTTSAMSSMSMIGSGVSPPGIG